MIQAEAQAAKNSGPLDPPASIPLRKIPASVLLCFCLRVELRADAKPGAPAEGQLLPVVAGMAPAPAAEDGAGDTSQEGTAGHAPSRAVID